jgi:hypothetical protein
MGTAPENDGLQLGSGKDDQQRQYSGFTFQTTAPVPAAVMAGTSTTASSFLQSSMPMAQLVRKLI